MQGQVRPLHPDGLHISMPGTVIAIENQKARRVGRASSDVPASSPLTASPNRLHVEPVSVSVISPSTSEKVSILSSIRRKKAVP